MEEILIISNYYPPEKGAAANRIEQLALKLNQNNYKVTVLCPLGNYPKGKIFDEYKGKFSVTEIIQNITVKRLWIYPSVSKNVLVRLVSILSFSSGLFFYLLVKKTPLKIVVQSPPLLLSFLSVLVLSLKRKKIILNISDLWPLAAIELNALKENSFSHQISLFMEKFIYKKASVIIGQSNEILSHVSVLYPNKECHLYRNFPDHKLTNLGLIYDENKTIKIFYAGLFGVAQGIFDLCKNIQLNNLNMELHLFGDGAENNQIQTFLKAQKDNKIIFHGMLNRNELHEKTQSFDVAIVPLKTRIFGSVPSKIFEYSAMGFPVLYCGGGEGELLVTENNLGWVSEVGNFDELNKTLKQISELSKSELFEKKKMVFNTAQVAFSLEKQMHILLNKKVF